MKIQYCDLTGRNVTFLKEEALLSTVCTQYSRVYMKELVILQTEMG